MEEQLAFPGTYEDSIGREDITWRIDPFERRRLAGYEIHTVIRGVEFWGYDFDGLEPTDPTARGTEAFSLEPSGDLTHCVLTGELPCAIDRAETADGVVTFRLTLPASAAPSPGNLRLSTVVDGELFELVDDWFEDGLLRLNASLPSATCLRCCVTCLFSDYSPVGHGLMGMRCHRDAKEQYLAVRSKTDYWTVPVAELVMETHLCREYQRRVPGTGYRG